jgi:hypothetical protein
VRSDAPKGRSPRFSVVVSVMVMELRRRPAKEKVNETCDGAGLVLCARLRVPPGSAESQSVCESGDLLHPRTVATVMMVHWLATGPEFYDCANPVLGKGHEVLP